MVEMFQEQGCFPFGNTSQATDHQKYISIKKGILDQPETEPLQTPENGLLAIKSEEIEIEVNLHENNPQTKYISDDANSFAHKNDFYRPGFVRKHVFDKGSKLEIARSKCKRILYCKYCPRTFKFQSQLIVHERIHTGEKPFPCSECEKRFSKKSNLNLHIKVHIKNRMNIHCSYCHIKIAYSEYFTHMKTHEKTVMKNAGNLKQLQLLRPNSKSEINKKHIQKNEQQKLQPRKQKKLSCQYCGKPFRFQSALVRHERVHTGEKPYKCDICSKAFGQAYFLRVHELTHWSVKRYNCTRCSKAFVHYSNAKNHSCRPKEAVSWADTEKPNLTFTCHICREVFDHLQLFKNHMKEHTGAELYRCLKCDKLFGVLAEFNAHKKQCIPNDNSLPVHLQQDDSPIPQILSVTQYTGFKRLSGYDTVSSSILEKERKDTEKKHKTPPLTTTLLPATVTPARPLSHIVSCLNKLDNSSDPRKYFCPCCGRLFRHMSRLRAHMLTHRRDQSYICTFCDKTLENWKKLWLHQRLHRQRGGRFSCPLCGQGFRFVEMYRRHMSEHPDFQWVPVGAKKQKILLFFQCQQCKCKFRTQHSLTKHQLCHAKEQKKLCFSKPRFDFIPKQSNQKSRTNKSFSSQVKQNTYEITEIIPETFCSENTSSEIFMKKQKESSGWSHISQDGCSECTICGQSYSISDLYLHYLQHARGEL